MCGITEHAHRQPVAIWMSGVGSRPARRVLAHAAARRARTALHSGQQDAWRVACVRVELVTAANPYRLLRDSLQRHRGLHPHPLGLRLPDVVLDDQVAQRLVEVLEALAVYPIVPRGFFEQV